MENKKPTLHPDVMDLCYARSLALRDMLQLIENYRSGLENATVLEIESACDYMVEAKIAIHRAIKCLDGVNSLNYNRG